MSGECEKCGEHDLECKCELLQICHHMGYGDDSEKTLKRYCELVGRKFNQEFVDDFRCE